MRALTRFPSSNTRIKFAYCTELPVATHKGRCGVWFLIASRNFASVAKSNAEALSSKIKIGACLQSHVQRHRCFCPLISCDHFARRHNPAAFFSGLYKL